jgi:hypothetical protein
MKKILFSFVFFFVFSVGVVQAADCTNTNTINGYKVQVTVVGTACNLITQTDWNWLWGSEAPGIVAQGVGSRTAPPTSCGNTHNYVVSAIINGQCKAAAILPHSSTPTAPLCEKGTATTPTGTGPWSWNCNGSNGGTSVTCSAPVFVPINGQCKATAIVPHSSTPTAPLCETGTSTTPTGTGPWAWNCNGSNGGTNASCSAPKIPTPTPLTASCYGTPNPVVINNAATWHALVSGGTGPYTYSWSGTDGLTGTGSSVSKIYNTTGTKTASVLVTSGTATTSVSCFGAVSNGNCTSNCGITSTSTPIIVDSEDLVYNSSLNCIWNQVASSTIKVNTRQTWTINTPPSGTTISWQSPGEDLTSQTSPTLSHIFQTVGLKTITARVSSSNSYGECTATTTVNYTGGSNQEQ